MQQLLSWLLVFPAAAVTPAMPPKVMRYGIGECLVHFDDKMNAEPWIAESWKVSDDKMSWTFKIKDIKFSNGTPVTGEAVKKSIERTFAKSPRAKAMFESPLTARM